MNKDLNFLTKLQNHEVKPPAILFNAVKQQIAQENETTLVIKLKKLSSFTQAPPFHLEVAIKNKLVEKKFIKVKIIQPDKVPGAIGLLILNKAPLIKTYLKSTKNKNFTIPSFNRFIIPVAAGLLYIIAALISHSVLPITTNRFDDSFTINLPDEAAFYENNTSFLTVGSDKRVSLIPQHEKINNLKKVTKKETLLNTGLLEDTNFIVNGKQLKFIDNDFYASLASLNTETTDFFKTIAEGKDQTIRLNKYSSIVISAKMQVMMKKIHIIKDEDKDFNTVKKTQQEMLDWKQSDGKNFDMDINKNPLDPIDLFDFLIDN